MKYYKITNANLVGLVGEFNFIGYGNDASAYAQSETPLNAPFVEVEFGALPQEVRDGMASAFKQAKADYLKRAEVRLSKITTFESSVLGSNHIYDFGLEDQTNLLEAKAYIDGLGDTETVGIRCTASDGIKDNYPHTKAQVSALFKAWYIQKSSILDAYSTLKISLNAATTMEECEFAFQTFDNMF